MSTVRLRTIFCVLVCYFFPSLATAETLSIAGFHVESESSKVQTITNRLNSIESIDIWALTGIERNWLVDVYEAAAQAAPPKNELGRTTLEIKKGPTAAVLYNRKRLIRQTVVSDHAFFKERCARQFAGSSSVPLAIAFTDIPTETLFWFVAVPFGPDHRSNTSCFHQALADWVQSFDAPTIVFGTFDMNWTVSRNGSERHAAFDYMTSDGRLNWIEPDALLPTQCASENRAGNQINSFFLLSEYARRWTAFSEILFADPGYCRSYESAGDSSHRALLAVVDINNSWAKYDEHASIEIAPEDPN